MGVASLSPAQLTDVTQTPNSENAGIQRSYIDQIGPGRGDPFTPNSSSFLIQRDPFRSIARGRQLFQRKFRGAQGLGPRSNDGIGSIETNVALGAGLADSCAACHGRPRGSAGFGGDVFTRPDSRDAPHLFGLGLVEMLADEITADLRARRDNTVQAAIAAGAPRTRPLRAKGISFGFITALPNGQVDVTNVQGVDSDLRVKPFFAEGSSFSIREFAVGAFHAEMGLQAYDPDLETAANGGVVTTPSGLVLDGTKDSIPGSPAPSATADPDADGVVNEIPVSIVDHMEFYLLNYFRPGRYRRTVDTARGRSTMVQIGCTECHVPNLTIMNDRRVADVDTRYNRQQGVINTLFATATPLFQTSPGGAFPDFKTPAGNAFVVRNIFTDLKRHDLGPKFWERNFDGTITKEFVTEPLWGVGSTAPYGHDGRSINLREVILRHGGEAQASRNAFASLSARKQDRVIAYLNSLILFGPADTASNLNPGDDTHPDYPVRGHGSIDLSVLFNIPGIKE